MWRQYSSHQVQCWFCTGMHRLSLTWVSEWTIFCAEKTAVGARNNGAVWDKLLCETSKPGKCAQLRNMGNRKTITWFDEDGAFSLVKQITNSHHPLGTALRVWWYLSLQCQVYPDQSLKFNLLITPGNYWLQPRVSKECSLHQSVLWSEMCSFHSLCFTCVPVCLSVLSWCSCLSFDWWYTDTSNCHQYGCVLRRDRAALVGWSPTTKLKWDTKAWRKKMFFSLFHLLFKNSKC